MNAPLKAPPVAHQPSDDRAEEREALLRAWEQATPEAQRWFAETVLPAWTERSLDGHW